MSCITRRRAFNFSLAETLEDGVDEEAVEVLGLVGLALDDICSLKNGSEEVGADCVVVPPMDGPPSGLEHYVHEAPGPR
jgi:hypothetical protein